MSKLIAGITLSLDGFMADPDGDAHTLYSDFDTLMESEVMQQQLEETGSVLLGRRMFDAAEDPDSYAVDYEFQCPIVVVTHEAPEHVPARNEKLFIEFATDGLPAAVERAKELAGDRDVTGIFGSEILSQLLELDLVDELRIDVMPVILGRGRRYFDGIDRPIELETLDVVLTGPRTSLHLAVRRES